MGLRCSLCFLLTIGSTCQYVLKRFFWVKRLLSIPKAHMSLDTLQGAATSWALEAGVSQASILEAGDWARVSSPTRHDFLLYITTKHMH